MLFLPIKENHYKKNVHPIWAGGRFMVFNATFKNISVIAWRPVLLVGEPEYQEKSSVLPQVTDQLYHIMLYQVHLAISGFELATFVVIGIDCKGNCKFNYQTIKPMMPPSHLGSCNF